MADNQIIELVVNLNGMYIMLLNIKLMKILSGNTQDKPPAVPLNIHAKVVYQTIYPCIMICTSEAIYRYNYTQL